MRLTLVAALVALAVGSSPVHAASLGGMGKAIFGNAFDFKKANLDKVPVNAIKVGKLEVVLQRTRLNEIRKAYGGTIQRQGDGSERADWLCYYADGANVWFVANALGGFEFVMMVAAEAAKKPGAGCEDAPADFAVPSFGVPGLGAGIAELKDTFGSAPVRSGKISYRADEPGADALGTANNAQYIGYVVSGKKVTGIGIGETSVQIAK